MNKIKVLMSCDDNPFYYEFWNDVSHMWKNVFGFEPVLFYISDEDNRFLSEDNGTIIRIPKIKNVPVYLQAQTARIYFAKMFKDDVCLLSDIDIIPIDKSFFNVETILKNVKKDEFFHLNPTKREFGQFPMCYYVAYGNTYEKMFNDNTWEEFINKIIKYDFNAKKLGFMLPKHLEDKQLWFSDELFLHSEIAKNSLKINLNNKIILPNERLDREQLLSPASENVKQYVDCHMPRPFSMYEKQISYLIYKVENND